MNNLPHTAADPDAAVEARAIADLESLDWKLHAKKSQKSVAVPDNAERKQSRSVAFIGIDPGATGCAALVHDHGHDLFDWPGDPALVVPRLVDWLAHFDVRLAALEKVGAMPGQGVVSMFSFGQNVGVWHGILAALGIPYVCPRPQEWQRGLVDRKAGKDTKAASLATARRLFPDADLGRKKDHGRADALLLAWWARRQGIGSGSPPHRVNDLDKGKGITPRGTASHEAHGTPGHVVPTRRISDDFSHGGDHAQENTSCCPRI